MLDINQKLLNKSFNYYLSYKMIDYTSIVSSIEIKNYQHCSVCFIANIILINSFHISDQHEFRNPLFETILFELM